MGSSESSPLLIRHKRLRPPTRGTSFTCMPAASTAFRIMRASALLSAWVVPYALGFAFVVTSAIAAESEFMWSGAVTPTTAVVKARLVHDSAIARLAVSDQSDFSSPLYFGPDTADAAENNKVVSLSATGLEPNQRYSYALEVDGLLDTSRVGHFHTFPADSGSFTFAFASCAQTYSNHQVFETILSHDPLFFFHLGDMHYRNIAVNDRAAYRAAFDTVLATPRQAQLFLEHSIAYVWDDHDFGPNNSDSTAPGREAARLTYREYVPHYPLVAGPGNASIHQAFTVGRVRFLVCDARSNRSPFGAIDTPAKTMLGVEQKAWLKQQLLAARDSFPLVVWVNTLPWIGSGDDAWWGYSYERRELGDFIAANQIDNLCMISGDAHMLAIDDGSHSDYSTAGYPGFPVMHAAALDQSGSVKGGPYSSGTFPGRGQFGLMTVIDTGDSIEVHWSGRNYLDSELVSYRFARPIATPTGVPSRESSPRPETIFVRPAYPNPFNGGTTLQFNLSHASHVTLDIYNTLGQRVRSLFGGVLAAGTCSRTWDGRDDWGGTLPSGTYYARLRTADHAFTRPLLMLK